MTKLETKKNQMTYILKLEEYPAKHSQKVDAESEIYSSSKASTWAPTIGGPYFSSGLKQGPYSTVPALFSPRSHGLAR